MWIVNQPRHKPKTKMEKLILKVARMAKDRKNLYSRLQEELKGEQNSRIV